MSDLGYVSSSGLGTWPAYKPNAGPSGGGALSRQNSSSVQLLSQISSLNRTDELAGVPSQKSSTGASNLHRKQLSPEIPFGSVIHFTNHRVSPSVLKPWKVSDRQYSSFC